MNNKSPHPCATGQMYSERKILCPVCGSDRTYPWALRCNPAGQQGGEVTITDQGIQHDHLVAPEGRGVAIEIDLACESGHVFAAKFHFHKGRTTLSQLFLYDEGGDKISGVFGKQIIWRD